MGGCDLEDQGSRPVWRNKKKSETPSQQKEAVMKHKKEGSGPGRLGHKVRYYLQNNQSKKDWRCGSSCIVPA
jgi:hypothetical protein